MGSGLCSFEEAAERLGKSKRSIHLYVAQGRLKKVNDGGKKVLDRESVDLMAVDLQESLQPMNRKTLFKIQSSVTRLEEEMRAVKHALELRDAPPLRPDTNGCLGLISACARYAAIQDKSQFWTTNLVDSWADLFERMDEETFTSFANASNNPHAWVPFFKFCSDLMDFCWANDAQRPSLEWQARAGRLATARQRLRGVVVALVEMGKGTVPPQFLEALGTPREALVAQVAKGVQASG